MCGYINNTVSLVSLYQTGSLINRWLRFPDHGHELSINNGIMSLENDVVDRPNQAQQFDRVTKFYCRAFYCQVFCFLDHEIMSFPGTGRMSWGHQPSLRNWVIIKVSYRYLRKYLLNCMYQDWDLSILVTERYTLGPLSNAHSVTLASTWLMSQSQRMLYYGTSKEYFPGTRLNQVW